MRKSIYRFLVIAALLLGFTGGFIFIKNPLGLRFFVVESGSMQPAFSAGSVVFTAKAANFKAGDVITFTRPIGQTLYVTHRIMEVENGMIKTKGDANNALDDGYILQNQILGKMIFAIPYLGFFFIFMRTLPGIAIFILLPSAAIIFLELKNIQSELRKGITGRKAAAQKIILSVVAVLGLSLLLKKDILTNAFYAQQKILFTTQVETVSQNTNGENPLSAVLNRDNHELKIKVEDVPGGSSKIAYEITYQTKTKPQGIKGEAPVDDSNSVWEKTFVLGTCSANGVCVYDEEVKDIVVTVTVTNSNKDIILTQNVQN